MTFVEIHGSIAGAKVAWVGDGNNVCHSWMAAASLLGFELHIASPEGYGPQADLVDQSAGRVHLSDSPQAACTAADLITTDVWASMGQEADKQQRIRAFTGYEVNQSLLALANKDAVFMHCLPAHRGEEVSAEVIDGPQSVVWQEAENRLHAQKALMLELLK